MDEIKKRCKELFGKVTPEMQSAISWTMENRDIVDEMCREKMTIEEWKKHMENAKKKQDIMRSILLLYKKIYDEQRR